MDCEKLTDMSIKAKLEYIPTEMFLSCYALKNVSIPDSVKYIYRDAFYYCISLTNIDFPKNLLEIGPNAFGACFNLTNIQIPESVTKIYKHAFSSCNKLGDVYLPSNIEYIGEDAFPKARYAKLYVHKDSLTEKTLSDANFTYNYHTINIKNLNFSKVENQTYTGKYIKPSVLVSSTQGNLVKNVDYTVEYLNNKNVGTATIRIKGMGAYSGSYDINFKINPKSTTSFTVNSTTPSTIKLNWNKVSSADGYAIYRYNTTSKTYVRIATVEGNSILNYTDRNRKYATKYSYRIKPIKRANGTTYYGNYTKTVAVTNPLKPSIKLKSSLKKKVTISWNKINNASGYKIYRSTSKKGTYSLVKTITSGSTTSYTNSNLSSSKTYYYKIKAYRRVDDKNYYSLYSDVKYIKVK